jgi:hemerythrin-like domain-containing protein
MIRRITMRSDPMSPRGSQDPDSFDEVLGEDHRILGAHLGRLREAISGNPSKALEGFRAFARVLEHHMTWEEETLFPAVREHATPREKRSIESLEIDHERLRDSLSSLRSALSSGASGTATQALEWLETLLKGHNYDEEHGVYVEADRYLAVEERRRMIRAFQAAAREYRG